ncbi:MAG: transcriptional repressor LexA [Pirellulales bacterium]|nr:transcriptional repressor LexA [Pirellulales bacterium]
MEPSPKRRGRRPVSEVTDSQLRALREIRDFIAERGMPPTSKELAERLGVSPATAHEQIGQLVRKGFLRREPNKARGISLVRDYEDAPEEMVTVPLLGSVAAGAPLFAEENVLGEVVVDKRLAATGRHFALRIVGDSMRDASIADGDLVVVRQQPVAQHNDIVVALVHDAATVKRLSIQEHEIELRPANPEFQPIPIGPDDDFRIVGKVVAVRRRPGE